MKTCSLFDRHRKNDGKKKKNHEPFSYKQLHIRLSELSEEFALYAKEHSDGYVGMVSDKIKTLAKELAIKGKIKP